MIARLVRRLRYWMRHRRTSRELAEEIEFHRKLRQRDFEQSGLPARDAAAASRRALGNTLTAAEDARDVWIWPWLERLWQDLLYGARIMRRNPGFTATAILTLALGIAADTAVFSVVKAVLLNPLPYPESDRLVMIWESNPGLNKERDPVAPLNFQDWQKEETIFESVAAYRFEGFVLTGTGEPEQVGTLAVSASLFKTLGVDASAGRTFTEEEERKRDRVVLLSHEFWQRRFGGDRTLIGRSLNLGAGSYVVVGVMPPLFRFPDDNVTPVETYSPLTLNEADLRNRTAHTLGVVARLKQGITIERARDHMNDVARRIAAGQTESNPAVAIFGVHEIFVEDIRLALLVTLAAVTFLLLVACANVASLQVAQGLARGREIAVRASLGASRWRIVRQLITENVLLSIVGGIVGLLLARWFIGAFLASGPRMFAGQNVAMDLGVLAFALLVAMLTGVTFGLVPAWQISRADLNRQITAGSSSGRKQDGRPALVVVEVMLSLLLLACAGLMVRSVLNLRTLDYGFNPKNLFTMQLFVSQTKYPSDTAQFRPNRPLQTSTALSPQARLYNDLVDRLKMTPGIQNAAAVSALPLSPVGIDYDLPVSVEGRPRPPEGEVPQADFRMATADYFATMGIPVLKGRGFTEADTPNSPRVVVINETMARRFFDGEDPIGKRIVFYGAPREVIGIVKSVRHRGFRIEPNAEMIVPSRQFQQFGGMTIVVRSSASPASLENLIKRELREIDRDLPLSNARTMESLLADSVIAPYFTTTLLASIALLAVVLAGVGMYGVVSLSVTQRTHEIGLRMALGAGRGGVIGMFARSTLVLVAIGVVSGVGAALAATRLMRGLLFGVVTWDPPTYVVSALVLVVAAMAAACGPAIRATRIDPLRALKHDG